MKDLRNDGEYRSVYSEEDLFYISKYSYDRLRISNGSLIKEGLIVDKNKIYSFSALLKTNTEKYPGEVTFIVYKVVAGSWSELTRKAFETSDGWVPYELLLTPDVMEDLGADDEIAIKLMVGSKSGGVDVVYGTDIRFHAEDALVTTHYYHPKWLTEVVTVDANRKSVQIELDSFGRLYKQYNNRKKQLSENTYVIAALADGSNNLLAELKVAEMPFEFYKNDDEYHISVPNATEYVHISARAESELSFVTIEDSRSDCPCAQKQRVKLTPDITEIAIEVDPPNHHDDKKTYKIFVHKSTTCWQYFDAHAGVSGDVPSAGTAIDYSRTNEFYTAYRSATDGRVYVMEYDFSEKSWISASSRGVKTGFHGDIAFKYPHLLYVNKAGELVSNSLNGSGWGENDSIGIPVGGDFSLSCDIQRIPYVTYVGKSGMDVKFYKNHQWNTIPLLF